MVSHKRRTNSRAFENLARRAVALLRHFFHVSRFRRYERMHKYTLPVNKISRPRKKDSLSNVVRYSYRVRLPPNRVPLPFFSLIFGHAFYFFLNLSLSISLSHSFTLRYKHENDALVNRWVKNSSNYYKIVTRLTR